jgi:nucleoside-diphosphate-sugar epimerase
MRNIGKGTRVAVIGGAGFLGSHCVEHLVNDRQCKVLVVDNLVVGRLDFLSHVARSDSPAPGWAFEHADVTGSEQYLKTMFEGYQIEYAINYSAYPYIPDSFARPLHVCDVNFAGACKVINAAQEAGCKGILQISSAEIFGRGYGTEDTPSQVKLDEDAPIVPHSSYGTSKAAADFFCQVSWRERKTPVLALRQFNCCGERDYLHPYVIPTIVKQLLESPPIVYLGNNSFRDFLYAGDQVKIAVELLEKGQWGECYNLGSETGIRVYDLALLIGKLMKVSNVQVIEDSSRKRPWEIWHLCASNEKLYKAIGNRPKLLSLEESIGKTVDSLVSAYKTGDWK